jgi:hypothetical protein
MKKGLLSILAGALVVVGCQNYDDQFDQLESQINALASTVAGLSAVQSDLAALSAQVNSLSGAVDAAVDAALAGGLADIQSAIDALNAAAESASNNSDITQIAEDVDSVQDDLSELLAQSSVFTGNVVVATPATLDAFHAMGSGLAIVNGEVDIDVSSDMDIAKVQELVNFIEVTTGDYAYTAGSGVDTEVTFSNLTGTQSLTLDQEGGYMLENLESATIITLDDDSSVDVVHLGSLTSVTSLNGGTFTFNKATELHLTSLPRSPHTSLTLGVDEGGVIDMSSLTDLDADGDAERLNLTVQGPTNLTISTLTGDKSNSSVTATEVENFTVNGYNGAITIGQDVLNFTSDNVVSLTVSGDDLVSFSATGVLDPNDEDDEEGPAISLTNQSDLETVSIAGNTDSVVIGTATAGNGNLVSVTVAGSVVGAGGISIVNNSDLTTVDVSGATTDKLVIDGNSDLEELTIDFTTAAGNADEQEGTITVNDNESLTSLTISTDNVDNLSITNNVDLETIDLSGMSAIGAAATPAVYITGNDLNAEVADEEDEAFDTESGMDTAADYLEAVAAVGTDAAGEVHFDMVDSVIDSDGDESANDVADYIVWKSGTDAVTEGAFDETVEKRAFNVDLSVASGIQLTVDGVQVFHDGSNYGAVTMTDNQIIDKGNLLTNLASTRATDLGFTLDIVKGGNYTLPTVTFLNSVSSVANGEYFSNTAAYNLTTKTSYLTTYDEFTINIGGRSARVSIDGTTTSSVASDLADALQLAWGKKWATGGTSANFSFWSTGTGVDGDAIIETVSLKSSNSGSRAGADTIAITWERATSAQVSIVSSGARTESVVDWTYAGDSNATISEDLIIKMTEVTDGVISSGNATVIGGGITEITTNLLVNASAANTDTTTTIYPTDGRGDAVANEDGDEGVVTQAAVAAQDKIDWL